MGVLATIGGGISTFFRGDTGKTVINAVDEAFSSHEERLTMDAEDTKGARTMQYQQAVVVPNKPMFDVLVDAYIRLQRPLITTWIVGAVAGLWPFPKPKDPFLEAAFWIVITFHYGGRAIMRDIPEFLKALGKWRKK